MAACPLCRGLEELLRNREVEQVILRGRNEAGRITWIVDVLTVGAEGHRSAQTLEEAMDAAIREAITETNGPGLTG